MAEQAASLGFHEVRKIAEVADYVANKDKATYKSPEAKLRDNIGGSSQEPDPVFYSTSALREYLADEKLTIERLDLALRSLDTISLTSEQKQEWSRVLSEAKANFSAVKAEARFKVQAHDARQSYSFRLDGRDWTIVAGRKFKTADNDTYDVYTTPNSDKTKLDLRIDDSLWKDTIITGVPAGTDLVKLIEGLQGTYGKNPGLKPGGEVSYADIIKDPAVAAKLTSVPAPVVQTLSAITTPVKLAPREVAPTLTDPRVKMLEKFNVAKAAVEKDPKMKGYTLSVDGYKVTLRGKGGARHFTIGGDGKHMRNRLGYDENHGKYEEPGLRKWVHQKIDDFNARATAAAEAVRKQKEQAELDAKNPDKHRDAATTLDAVRKIAGLEKIETLKNLGFAVKDGKLVPPEGLKVATTATLDSNYEVKDGKIKKKEISLAIPPATIDTKVDSVPSKDEILASVRKIKGLQWIQKLSEIGFTVDLKGAPKIPEGLVWENDQDPKNWNVKLKEGYEVKDGKIKKKGVLATVESGSLDFATETARVKDILTYFDKPENRLKGLNQKPRFANNWYEFYSTHPKWLVEYALIRQKDGEFYCWDQPKGGGSVPSSRTVYRLDANMNVIGMVVLNKTGGEPLSQKWKSMNGTTYEPPFPPEK